MALHPIQTLKAMKEIFQQDDTLGYISDVVKQDYIKRIEKMTDEFEKAGASGSFNAGKEFGKLLTDVASLLSGGAGIVKGGAALTGKVAAKVVGKGGKEIAKETTKPLNNHGSNDKTSVPHDKVESVGTQKPSVSNDKQPVVVAELDVNGNKFKDTNQTARPIDKANESEATLIADKIKDKEKSKGRKLPNSNMYNAHAEIGAIQQAHNAGVAKGADLKLTVKGKEICSYCHSDIVSAAKAAEAKSVTIFEEKTGLTYYWHPGMKKLKVKK